MSYTISTFFQYIRDSISPYYGVQEAGYVARMILEYLYQQRWQQLFAKDDMPISAENIAKTEVFLVKLLKYQPIQYVLQEAYFYERKFSVNEQVLIPRGETEELMLWAVDEVRAKKGLCKVLDIGTGSGCIPISIWLELKEKGIAAQICGVDISEEALEIARKNAVDLAAKVDFVCVDILQIETEKLGKWDIIVSNPPYIPLKDKAEMETHVKDFEPHLALFVPDEDPLLFYRTIAEKGKTALNEHGVLLFEIYTAHATEICEMLRNMGYKNVICRQDIHGKARMVKAEIRNFGEISLN